jgi:hypothetical protein
MPLEGGVKMVISTFEHYRIWKRQLVMETGDEGLTAAEQFYALAA